MTENEPNKEQLLRKAYENGYKYYEYTNGDIKRQLILSGSGTNSWKQTVWYLEDKLNIGKYDDWDNQGVYHIFEDCSIAYEQGAKDGLNNEEFNPDSIVFLQE